MKFNFISLVRSVLFGICLILIGHNISAQSIGVSSGVGIMTFFDFHEDSDYSFTEYNSGEYQFVKFDLINYLPDAPFLKLSINLGRSVGTAKGYEHGPEFCGLGIGPDFGENMNSELTIYRVGLRLVPLNIKVHRGFNISLGSEVSKTFRSFENKISESIDQKISFLPNEKNPDDSPVNDIGIGIILEFEFHQFNIGNRFQLSPVYSANISLSNEIETGFNTKSIRQALGLAFRWDLKSKNDLKI